MEQTRPLLPHEMLFGAVNSMNAALRPPAAQRETLDRNHYDDNYYDQLYADERAVTVKKPVTKRNSEIDMLNQKVNFTEEGAMLIGQDKPKSYSPHTTTNEKVVKDTPKARKIDISDMLGLGDDRASHKNRR